jgi:hypothetical protein
MLPTLHADTAFISRMRRNDDSLSEMLAALLEQYDFLNEDVIGYNFPGGSTFSAAPLYGVIALHQIQKGGRRLNNLLFEAVKAGKLKSDIACSWQEQTFNLTARYRVYSDTLWKLRVRASQPTFIWAGMSDSMMKEYWINDSLFDIVERVGFNYRKHCKSCKRPVPAMFIIYPSSPIIGSFKAPARGERPYRMADHYEVLMHP